MTPVPAFGATQFSGHFIKPLRKKACQLVSKVFWPIDFYFTRFFGSEGNYRWDYWPYPFKKYSIGVVRDDVGEQLLAEAGVGQDTLAKVPNPVQNLKKLQAGRVDLLAYEESVTKWLIKDNNLKSEDFETVYVLKEGGLYYALNKDTSDAIVQTLQQGLDAVKKEGGLQKILDRYL